MQSISNRQTPSSFEERNWGPGFSTTVTKPSVKSTLSLSPGPLIKGKHSDEHPWSFSKVIRSFGPNNFWQNYRYPYGTSQRGPGAGGYPSSPVPTVTAADPYNEALSRIYEQIRGGMDLSVDIAEYKQTSRMISGAANQILGIARRLTSIGGITKSAADTWLQWQYGVRPLMGTIYDLSSHQIGLTLAPKRYKARSQNRNSLVTTGENAGGISLVWGKRTQEIVSRVQIIASFSVSDAERFALSTYSSLNPLSIAWELTPYSFVADWFFDVGGYLRMAETALFCGLQCHGGSLTRTTKATSESVAKGYVRGNPDIYYDCTALTEVRAMQRSVLGPTMPMPQLPSFDVKLGSQRLLSAAALLRQILK